MANLGSTLRGMAFTFIVPGGFVVRQELAVRWPALCSCCGAPAGTTIVRRAEMSRLQVTGSRKTVRFALPLPVCAPCRRHVDASDYQDPWMWPLILLALAGIIALIVCWCRSHSLHLPRLDWMDGMGGGGIFLSTIGLAIAGAAVVLACFAVVVASSTGIAMAIVTFVLRRKPPQPVRCPSCTMPPSLAIGGLGHLNLPFLRDDLEVTVRAWHPGFCAALRDLNAAAATAAIQGRIAYGRTGQPQLKGEPTVLEIAQPATITSGSSDPVPWL